MQKVLFLILITAAISCKRHATIKDRIYDLMAFVIADQQLNKTYGINIEPEERCTLDKTDEEFLSTLVLNDDTDNSNDTTKLDPMAMMFEIGQLSKCLTKEDVQLMLDQKQKNNGLQWDNSKLGFNNENIDHWYVFSIPLISKDGTKAVMMVRELCPGLCGRGWTLLLKKEAGKWTSETGLTWIH